MRRAEKSREVCEGSAFLSRYKIITDRVSSKTMAPCRHFPCLTSMCWEAVREESTAFPPGGPRGTKTSVRTPHSVRDPALEACDFSVAICSVQPTRRGCTSALAHGCTLRSISTGVSLCICDWYSKDRILQPLRTCMWLYAANIKLLYSVKVLM